MIELFSPTLPLAIRGRGQMFDTANRVERATVDVPYLSCGCSALRDSLLAYIRH